MLWFGLVWFWVLFCFILIADEYVGVEGKVK